MITPVVLCGGSGSRLWPLSRAAFPKQFLKIGSDRSLLRETLARLGGLQHLSSPLVVCGDEQRFITADHLQDQDDAILLVEASRCNTGPAATAAAIVARERDEDAIILLLPSDHLIRNLEAFSHAVAKAEIAAAAGMIAMFGITPEGPSPLYGYIERGEAEEGTYRVASFVEKPDSERAAGLLETGRYYWNSGMFMCRADVLISEMTRFKPEIVACAESAVAGMREDLAFQRLGPWGDCPSEPIDKAIMESTDKAVVIPGEFGWSDVGSWSTMHAVFDPDENGNTAVGNVVLHEATNSHAHTSGGLLCLLGVDNIAVVNTPDATLVSSLDHVDQLSGLVESLKGRPEATQHWQHFRPWGYYEILASGEGYQAKRLVLHPGRSISLQRHRHRSEHWVVVSGVAEITKGSDQFIARPGESTFVLAGEEHCLRNPEDSGDLCVIEVQIGGYLGEDDIERIRDPYDRNA
jgi:mannose-1-phosphate guanylyltransferase / mannose-6-phosphate isomerase